MSFFVVGFDKNACFRSRFCQECPFSSAVSWMNLTLVVELASAANQLTDFNISTIKHDLCHVRVALQISARNV